VNWEWRRVVGLGMALWFLPALLVCSTFEYQSQIRWGLPQISVYIEYYGVGLIVASAIAWGVVRLASTKGWLVLYTGIVSVLLAGALAMTDQANRQVTHHLSRGWHDERLNLEAALKVGLAEEIPDHSTLILQHRYSWWHDFYACYFYYQHAGKKLHFTWIPRASPDLSPDRAIAIGLPVAGLPNGRVFVLLDGVRDSHSGYVLLGPWDAPAAISAGASGTATIAVRLFVHGRSKATTCPKGALALVSPGSAKREFSTADLKLLRQGDDWALYVWSIDKDVLGGLLREP